MDRKLDAGKVTTTIVRLSHRIEERFPKAGLANVCRDLAALAEDTARIVRDVAKPYPWLRMGVGAVLLLGGVSQFLLIRSIDPRSISEQDFRLTVLFPAVEAAVNLLVIFGATIFFLWTLEERLKRKRILKGLYELRSIAHVIDMHQLTKDPTVLLKGSTRTASSPERFTTEFELTKYLEYCAEMQALTGKLAALYAQDSRDPLVIEVVNDLEAMAANLGKKIWQKITILHRLDETRV